MEIRVNNEKTRIGFQYQCNYNCKYDYIFILNEDSEEEWANIKKELGKSSIKTVWRMSVNKDAVMVEKQLQLPSHVKDSSRLGKLS